MIISTMGDTYQTANDGLPRDAETILGQMRMAADGIWGNAELSQDQRSEVEFRRTVADRRYTDYLAEVARHHSVPVMDHEVRRFLARIPPNGWIVDVGGCWGWHWRDLPQLRPDVSVCIVDLVRENFSHARQVLSPLLGNRVHLIHGDATHLQFPDVTFDGYWSVQTLQHVPNFGAAVSEMRRVLRPNGVFSLYSLNDAALWAALSRLIGRAYHRIGPLDGAFYLERLSQRQIAAVVAAFGPTVRSRFTEILFNPDWGITRSGRAGSWMGEFDAALSGAGAWRGAIARQHSLHGARSS